jgi:uncharacterized membrane protein
MAASSEQFNNNGARSPHKRSAWWWLGLVLFVLIPIPFGHWWLTTACLLFCALLAYLLFARRS